MIEPIRSEIRDFRQATTSSFNAMREDLTDLRGDVTDLRRDVTNLREHVDDGFTKVDRGFIEMRGKFDATAAGQQQIVDLLNTLMGQQGDDQPGDMGR